ncbi:Rrf2 family transcriptional regulator [Oscillospiraceae bacterium LCP25S3_E10]|nr:Rrf2 family transcriptional regulator [Ruminococcus sp.]MDD6446767.1 Rrf2 family transcriptional regulator [Ruminococcus sp.]MDY2856178.1 Rrf2 family transcriptional regulator [Oscillospiraceae bacterium]
MKISTKVEFGIIAIIDIATYSKNGSAVTTPEIAKRQNISKKYLEQILSCLSSAALVRGQKGSNGGYVIAKKYSDITFKDIINALDVSVLSDVYFSTQSDNETIVTLINQKLWDVMSGYLQKYADSITLEDIVESYKESTESQHSMPMYYI